MDVVSDWREAEAKALHALYQKHAAGVPHAAFGREHGLGSAGMVWQYLNGHRPLNLQAAVKFAKGLGVTIDQFSSRLADEARMAARFVSNQLLIDENTDFGELNFGEVLEMVSPTDKSYLLDTLRFSIERAAAHRANEPAPPKYKVTPRK